MAINFSHFWSTLGKKILMALTGLAMILFLLGHLAGNLLLLTGDPDPYNEYSHMLIDLGWLLIAVELILLTIFFVHVVTALLVTRGNRASRPQGYHRYKSAGAPSKKSLSSSTMIWTGVVLFVFTGLHLYTFKYGPGVSEGYVSTVNGVAIRDLYRLVVETFQNPWYVLWYVAAMSFLGFHLRHGFWSAFQSLGAHHPRYTPWIFAAGYLLAVIIGVGFLAIPVVLYLQGGGA